MGVIKAPNVPLSISPFSMSDIEDAAKRILLRARQQADQLLAAAQAEATRIKAEARVEGLTEGLRQGTAQGLEQGHKSGEAQAFAAHKAQFQQTIATFTQVAESLNASRDDLQSRALQEVVKLSIAIARRVTKRQGAIDPQVLIANLEEAMKLVVRHTDLRIEIHPSQRKTFESVLPQLGRSWPSLKHVEIVEDAALPPGGCRISTCQGQINADLDVQLDRVVADLLPGLQEAAE